jgi:hypothetical protein
MGPSMLRPYRIMIERCGDCYWLMVTATAADVDPA